MSNLPLIPFELGSSPQHSLGNTLGFLFSVPLPIFNRNQGEIERARIEHWQIEARVSALEADYRRGEASFVDFLDARRPATRRRKVITMPAPSTRAAYT